jgi:hypothetical protein
MASKKDPRKFVVASSFSRGEQWLNQILVIEPLRIEVVATRLGETQATIAKVVEVCDDGRAIDHGEAPMFWSIVQGQLTRATVEQPLVAGRLVKVGTSFRLDELNDDEQALVDRALARLDAA